jgi:hypothetical protein
LVFSLDDAGTVGGFRPRICLKSLLKIAALPVKGHGSGPRLAIILPLRFDGNRLWQEWTWRASPHMAASAN